MVKFYDRGNGQKLRVEILSETTCCIDLLEDGRRIGLPEIWDIKCAEREYDIVIG